MSGYPPGSGYPYGAPPSQPYGAPPSQPYGAPPAQQYGAPPYQQYGAPAQPYGAPPQSAPAPYGSGGQKPEKPGKVGYGYDSSGSGSGYPQQPAAGYGSPDPYGAPAPYGSGGQKPGKVGHGYDSSGTGSGYPPPPAAGYGSPFAALVPSVFPPGTDPNVVACFQAADADGSGFIDDKELQRALSSYNQTFSLRTVHLLMYLFTQTNIHKIGPKEFTSVFYSLQNWRGIFERFDRDRSGKIDTSELREALLSLGLAVSPLVLDLLVSKFDKTGGKNKAIEYDNFIECCLTVKGLTEKFKEKDTMYSGSATFNYETFMLTVLPFIVA